MCGNHQLEAGCGIQTHLHMDPSWIPQVGSTSEAAKLLLVSLMGSLSVVLRCWMMGDWGFQQPQLTHLTHLSESKTHETVMKLDDDGTGLDDLPKTHETFMKLDDHGTGRRT